MNNIAYGRLTVRNNASKYCSLIPQKNNKKNHTRKFKFQKVVK